MPTIKRQGAGGQVSGVDIHSEGNGSHLACSRVRFYGHCEENTGGTRIKVPFPL